MEFRWIIFLVLWTVFAGPILSRPNLSVALAQKSESSRKP